MQPVTGLTRRHVFMLKCHKSVNFDRHTFCCLYCCHWKNQKYLLYSSTHYKPFWEEASVEERRYFIIPLGKLGTFTIATTVLSNYVTITSLIRSGQSDVSRTFQDILNRSLIGQNCEGHTVPPHASTLHLSCILCAEMIHPVLHFAR